MKERFFDYRLRIVVPNDGRLHKAVLPLTDGSFVGDWPFELRAISFPTPFDPNIPGFPPYQSLIQIRTPDGGTFDNAPAPIQELDPMVNFYNTSGLVGRPIWWRPCFPFQVWPSRGTIEVDFYNSSAAEETVTVVFHGVHHVPDDLNTGALLPARFTKEYFDYVTVTHFTGYVQSFRDQILRIDGDSDFALCGIVSAYRFPTAGQFTVSVPDLGPLITWTNVDLGPVINHVILTLDSPDADFHVSVVGDTISVQMPVGDTFHPADLLAAAMNANPEAAALVTSYAGYLNSGSDIAAGVFDVGPGSPNVKPVHMDIGFKDQAGRRFSNALIDIRDQCQVIEAPASPRWFWPPVMIPRNGSFLFDLERNDNPALYEAAAAGDLYLRWIGYKIRPACG